MALLLLNIFCSCIATLIISSSFIDNTSKVNYVVSLLLLVLSEYCGGIYIPAFLCKIIVNTVLLTSLYNKSLRYSVFVAVTAEAIITFSVLLAGPIVYLFPDIQHTIIYNISICLLVITIAVILCRVIKNKLYTKDFLSKKVILAIFVIELLIIAPIPFLEILIKNNKVVTIIVTNILVFVVMLAACLIIYVLRVQMNLEQNIERRRNIKVAKNIISQKYKRIGTRSHFTGPALASLKKYIEASDVESIKNLYIEYIGPIHDKHDNRANLELLNLLTMPIITSFLYDISIRCPKFRLSISNTIDINEMDIEEIDLFLILAEYLNNALNFSDFKNSFVDLYFSKDNENYYIEIENKTDEKIDFCKYYKTKGVNGFMGFGLKLVEDIIKIYPLIVNNTYMNDSGAFVQSLIIPERKPK